jgi:hypothetical protein
MVVAVPARGLRHPGAAGLARALSSETLFRGQDEDALNAAGAVTAVKTAFPESRRIPLTHVHPAADVGFLAPSHLPQSGVNLKEVDWKIRSTLKMVAADYSTQFPSWGRSTREKL